MGYTLKDAMDSISEYSEYPAFTAAAMRLQIIAENNPRGLRAESARIREAFYVYDQGFNYGKAA
jgi:hypothetical protein